MGTSRAEDLHTVKGLALDYRISPCLRVSVVKSL